MPYFGLMLLLGSAVIHVFAYVIILYVIRMGALTSYVGAIREISVVFETVIGIYFLKEKGSKLRILGSVVVEFGVIVIKFAG
ncbi:MAG: hypothetical protein IPL26_18185 [Leptospiraceae bacterium]|nr:hypothetical protein [Leptospiraceae bacterium]